MYERKREKEKKEVRVGVGWRERLSEIARRQVLKCGEGGGGGGGRGGDGERGGEQRRVPTRVGRVVKVSTDELTVGLFWSEMRFERPVNRTHWATHSKAR